MSYASAGRVGSSYACCTQRVSMDDLATYPVTWSVLMMQMTRAYLVVSSGNG